MEELSFKSGGMLRYPVRNKSENFESDCEIRYAVSVEAGITNAAQFQKAVAGNDPEMYFKNNMPRFIREALRAHWGGSVPLEAFGNIIRPVQTALRNVLTPELAGYGLRLSTCSVLALSLKHEDEAALLAHETRKMPAREELEAVLKNIQTDDSFKPEKFGVEVSVTQGFVKYAPWKCGNCGKDNITSRFCPECGARREEPISWTCSRCGTRSLTGSFCPECGAPRP